MQEITDIHESKVDLVHGWVGEVKIPEPVLPILTVYAQTEAYTISTGIYDVTAAKEPADGHLVFRSCDRESMIEFIQMHGNDMKQREDERAQV